MVLHCTQPWMSPWALKKARNFCFDLGAIPSFQMPTELLLMGTLSLSGKVVNTKDSPGSGSWTLGDLGRFIFILSFSSYNGNRFITYLSPRPQPKLINVYVRASRGGSETFKERKTIWSFPTLADTYDPAGTYWSPRAVTILRNQLTINHVNHPGW